MESQLWNKMTEENNVTVTENGDKAYKSTLNGLMDFMFKAGTLRDSDESEIKKMFLLAYKENPIYAVRLAFYNRDIREGQGERRVFRICMKTLSEINIEYYKAILEFIPEYGRWDDLVWLYTNTNNAYKEILDIFSKQLTKDINNMKEKKAISLLAKWLPSENASAKSTILAAKSIRGNLKLTAKEYRVMLSTLRKYLNVTETLITYNKWNEIDYNHVPSKAMQKYTNAFNNHDGDRFQEYQLALTNGNAKINAGALYPFDIIHNLSKLPLNILDSQWKALPDFFKDKFNNALVVADVSGSMEGKPIEVCTSLAIYIAERNKGIFHNKFITFSANPELQEIIGNNIFEKYHMLSRADWDANTDINKVFELIYNTAIKNNLKQDDLPSMIYIISDMQFDEACDNEDKSVFEKWKANFEASGYQLPVICFWNVSAYGDNVPITKNDTGTFLCSGGSPSICKFIMESDLNNTIDLINNIVMSKRYANILKNYEN